MLKRQMIWGEIEAMAIIYLIS